MFGRNKLRNYAKGSDERIMEVTGKSALTTLIIGIGIFLTEMVSKVLIERNLASIIWEAVLLLIMLSLFILVHLLNTITNKS